MTEKNYMDDSESRDYFSRKFCDFIFKSDTLKDDSEANALNVLFILMERKKVHVPYEMITDKIFSIDGESLDVLPSMIKENLDNVSKNTEFKRKFCEDTIRHVQLAITQKNYIDGVLDNAKKELSLLDDIKKNIYTDFISILGIFTAITFATFGGLQLLGNVFGKINNYNATSVGSVLMLGAVYLLGTYFILVALLKGVSELTGKQYGTPFRTRYIIVYTFGAIFLFGILYAHKTWIRAIPNHWWITFFVALLIVIVAVVPFIADIFLKKMSYNIYDVKIPLLSKIIKHFEDQKTKQHN